MNRSITRMLFMWILLASVGWVGIHAQRTEKYRSQFHFSPNSGWIGDPDGLMHYRGVYHLFWWGHAVSTDLVHWAELPYPILGDGDGYQVTTGSAVIDKANVSGLGKNAFINFHTLVNGAEGVGISSSVDRAGNFRDFRLYPGNPILSPPSPGAEFRDPQVFWHAPSHSWMMVIAAGRERRIRFYRSVDLMHWKPSGVFGPDGGSADDMWETPDLFELPVDGSIERSKWVLTLGVAPNHMRYFIGEFDGKVFRNSYPSKMFNLDEGVDFYAARTWRDYDAKGGPVTLLGWMGNWRYSTVSPSRKTYGGTGISSVPRNLALKTYPGGIRLVQTPIPELHVLRQTAHEVGNIQVTDTHPISDFLNFHPSQNSYEIDATFTITSNARFGLNLLTDRDHAHLVKIEFDPLSSELSVDRTYSSDTALNNSFPVRATAFITPIGHELRLHIFVDRSSIELFANDGETAMTLLTYPGESQTGIELFSLQGSTTLRRLKAWVLRSIWSGSPTNRIGNGEFYAIKARHDGKAMEDSGHGLQQGAWVRSPNQKWRVDQVELGHYEGESWIPTYYSITNARSQKVVELLVNPSSNSTDVRLADWSNQDRQKWEIEEIGGNFYKISSKLSRIVKGSEALEIPSASTRDGESVQAGKFSNYPHQEWEFHLLKKLP